MTLVAQTPELEVCSSLLKQAENVTLKSYYTITDKKIQNSQFSLLKKIKKYEAPIINFMPVSFKKHHPKSILQAGFSVSHLPGPKPKF